MKKPIVKIGLSRWDYAGYINLGNRVIGALTGNGNFTAPAVTLVNLQAAVTAAEIAHALWAPVGARGSSADLLDLRAKNVTLAQLLKAESQYVMTQAQITAGNDFNTMAAILGTSGFELGNDGSPQGLLEAVQNFHRFITRSLAPNQVKLKWKKPLNVTSNNNVKSYRVLRGTTNVFSAAVEIGNPTATTFTDTNSTGAVQTWNYWIVPVNAAGDGAPSEVVTVTVVNN